MNLSRLFKQVFAPSENPKTAGSSDAHQGSSSGRPATPAAASHHAVPQSAYAFISYSHHNEGVVRQLAAYLAQEEIPPWIDNRLEFGESWEDMILGRIAGCKVFLVVMSPQSRDSAFVTREIETALDLCKLIIPVLLAGEPFPSLAQYQYVNLLDTDHPHSRFIERLRDLLAPGQVPSRQLQRRRVEHFILPVFEEVLELPQLPRVSLGIGFDKAFGVQPQQNLRGKLDELNWMEIFMIIRERLPNRDLHCPLGTDFDARFPTIQAFIDFLMDTLTWNEIRAL